jgi:thiol-disulfide isomerase/thioredoxin
MRNDFLLLSLVASLGFSSIGCGGDSGEGDTNPPAPPPEFQPDQGQVKGDGVAKAYPAGPFGVSTYTVMENYKFFGFVNYMDQAAAVQSGEATSVDLQQIELADFYNPTGDEVFPEGSPYGAGNPKPKALLIDCGAYWCPPCRAEALTVLPGKYEDLHPKGVEFLFQLVHGFTYGVAGTEKNLEDWSKQYKVNYPAVIDPQQRLSALFAQDAYPNNFAIDTRTMKICRVIAGVPDESFWEAMERIANGTETSCQ